MISLRRILAITVARNREFWRDRAALTWSIAFPLLVIGGFSLAFRGSQPDVFKVAIVVQSTATTEVTNEPQDAKPAIAPHLIEFTKIKYVEKVWTTNEQLATEALRHHKYDLVLRYDGVYWLNSDSPKGYLLEKILFQTVESTTSTEANLLRKNTLSGDAIRYIDWLVSGLIGMNMMFSAMFGVGYVIIRYRKNGFLKRLKATPLKPIEFLCGQVLSRLLVTTLISILVFALANALVDFKMEGSYLNLVIVLVAGSIAMISLGLVVVAAIRSEELANGMLNLLTWPMMFLSGVWFSLEGAHPTVRQVANLMPLTHIIDAARSIMLDGADWTVIRGHIMILGVTSLAFLTVAAKTFSWESDHR